MCELGRLAEKIAEEVRLGKLKCQYSFEEFKAAVKKIPNGTDFSRLAKNHMETKQQSERKAQEEALYLEMNWGQSSAVTTDTIARASEEEPAHESIDLCSDDDDHRQGSLDDRSPRGATSRPGRKGNVLTPAILNSGKRNVASKHARLSPRHQHHSRFEDLSSSGDDDEATARADATIRKHNKKERRRRQQRKWESSSRNKSLKRARKQTSQKAPVEHGVAAKTRPSKTATEPDTAIDQRCATERAEEYCERHPGNDFADMLLKQLKKKCMEVGLNTGGTKNELIDRLKGPWPPTVWVERKKKGLYVPKYNTGAMAILVALHLHESAINDENALGMTGAQLFAEAEGLQISQNPFSGGTTQTGPYHYDGMSSLKGLLKGDPALVIQTRGRHYKLTRSCDLAGYNVAKACHKWCHQHGNCKNCGMTAL